MVFADFEKNAVNEALEKKMNVFVIKVSVDENCILKAARAFLYLRILKVIAILLSQSRQHRILRMRSSNLISV